MASGSNNPIIVNAHPPDLAHLGEPIDELEVSTRVVKQLGITHGDQTEVLIAFVKKVRYDLFVSASICLAKELGHYNFKIINDYTTPRYTPYCFLFIVKVDSSLEVKKLNGHMMWFGQETVDFRRVLKLSKAIWKDCYDWAGWPKVIL